ncbi:MAG: tetratricopeptide repeat protein, partial [Crocinitomicaceae bacterium]
YNVGNTFYNEGKFQDAINAYRDALRKNPNDAEARHNLSLAMRKNRNEQKKPKDKEDKNNDDKNDQNQSNNEDQQKKEDKKDQNQLDSKSKRQDGNQGKEKPVPQETSQELSNKDIEKRKVDKMLENLAIEEMKTKSKVNNAKGKSRRISKPW